VSDPIYASCLEAFRSDVAALPKSRALRIAADPGSGDPPRRYQLLFSGIEHFRREGGRCVVSVRPLLFQIDLPGDYCRCVDGSLPFRVLRALTPFVHPNLSGGGTICLGARFRPATRARPLLHQAYQIATSRSFATESPIDPRARDFFLAHLAEVRALRAEPLWEAPLAARVGAGEAS